MSGAACIFITAAASLLVYAPACEAMARVRQSSELGSLHSSLHLEGEEALEAMREEAVQYNRTVRSEQRKRSFSYRGEEASDSTYTHVMDPEGSGVMAELLIPSLGIDLPVVHGTRAEDLEYRCGHMYGTSVPVGGVSSHAVIAGHTGLVTAELFTRLTDLKKGEVFLVRVLGETHVYEIKNIRVVLPEDESPFLNVVEGRDLITLYTCTPYGINDHRLLVTGERHFPDLDDEHSGGGMISSEHMNVRYGVLAALWIAVPVMIPVVFVWLDRREKHMKRAGGIRT